MARVSKAEVQTANSAVLMLHLCQHWESKYPVQCGVTDGRIELPQARCLLKAGSHALAVRLELAAGADQSRLETIIEENLKRFGYREQLIFPWTRHEEVVLVHEESLSQIAVEPPDAVPPAPALRKARCDEVR
jgi:hypothetical protein